MVLATTCGWHALLASLKDQPLVIRNGQVRSLRERWLGQKGRCRIASSRKSGRAFTRVIPLQSFLAGSHCFVTLYAPSLSLSLSNRELMLLKRTRLYLCINLYLYIGVQKYSLAILIYFALV